MLCRSPGSLPPTIHDPELRAAVVAGVQADHVAVRGVAAFPAIDVYRGPVQVDHRNFFDPLLRRQTSLEEDAFAQRLCLSRTHAAHLGVGLLVADELPACDGPECQRIWGSVSSNHVAPPRNALRLIILA